MIGLNIQTSFLTPPFGFALFYLRGVAPKAVKTIQMYKGVVPFILLQLLALAVVGSYPPLVNYLPQRTSLLSDSAPPPKNPKLQYCLEKFVSKKLLSNDKTVQFALSNLKGVDVTMLPQTLANNVNNAVEDGMASVISLQLALSSEAAVITAATSYKPRLRVVRRIQKELRDKNSELKLISQEISRLNNTEGAESVVKELKLSKESLTVEIEKLSKSFPSDWERAYQEFSSLVKAENKARLMYRRQADNSYGSIEEIVNIIDGYEDLLKLNIEINNLRETIELFTPEEAAEKIKIVATQFGKISGASKIKSLLSKSRKQLKKKKVNKEKVLGYYDAALLEYKTQLGWMLSAQETVYPSFKAYLNSVSDTLGARLQEDLPRATSLYISSCISGHRDISLNF